VHAHALCSERWPPPAHCFSTTGRTALTFRIGPDFDSAREFVYKLGPQRLDELLSAKVVSGFLLVFAPPGFEIQIWAGERLVPFLKYLCTGGRWGELYGGAPRLQLSMKLVSGLSFEASFPMLSYIAIGIVKMQVDLSSNEGVFLAERKATVCGGVLLCSQRFDIQILSLSPAQLLVHGFNVSCYDDNDKPTIQDESIRGLVYTVTHNKVRPN